MAWPLVSALVLAPPLVFVAGAIGMSAVWKTREREILVVAATLSIALTMGACTTLFAIGGKDARIVVRNESSTPVYLSATYELERAIAPGSSDEIFSCGCGGPEFLDGLIEDVRITYGPSRSVSLHVTRVAGATLKVTVTQLGVAVERSETP